MRYECKHVFVQDQPDTEKCLKCGTRQMTLGLTVDVRQKPTKSGRNTKSKKSPTSMKLSPALLRSIGGNPVLDTPK